jgi:hypothetical protein
MSADSPFVDGVTDVPSFDTVVYQSSAFGAFGTLGGKSIFSVPFGVYLVVLQMETDTTPTKFEGFVEVASNVAGDVAGISSAGNRVSTPLSAVRLSSEIAIPGLPFPCAVEPGYTVTGGGNGNILATISRLFVWQLAKF